MIRGWWRRLAAVVVLVVGVLAVPGSASSDTGLNICPEYLAPEPEVSNAGVSGMIPSPLSESGRNAPDDAGRYQAHGIAGSQWHVIVSSNCFDPARGIRAFDVTGVIWDANRIGSDFVIFVYQLATSDLATGYIADLITPLVHGLRDGFWRPLIGTVVIISAIYLGWVGLVRKRASLTVEGTVWMVFSIAFAMWFLTFPGTVMALGNSLTNGATQMIHSSLSSSLMADSEQCIPTGSGAEYDPDGEPNYGDLGDGDTDTGGGGGTTDNEDADEGEDLPPEDIGGRVPPGDDEDGDVQDPAENDGGGPAESDEETDEDIPSFESPDEDDEGDGPPLGDLSLTPVSATTPINSADTESDGIPISSDEAVWSNSELMYCSLVIQPWMIGVFGSGGDSDGAASQYTGQALDAQLVTHEERDLWGYGENFNEPAYEATLESKNQDYRAVSQQIDQRHPDRWQYWSGLNQNNRMGTALVSLAGLALAGSFIVAASAAIIILKLSFMVCFVAAPFAFLIGIHPAYGPAWIWRFLELQCGFLLKQIFVSGALVIFLICYGHVFSLPVPWFMKIVIIGLLMWAVLKGRKRLALMFANASVGGMSRMMQRVADDKSLQWGAIGTNPAVAIRKADRYVANKAKPVVAAALSAMTGGAAGAIAGGVLNNMGKKPEQAPPLNNQGPTTPPRRQPQNAPTPPVPRNRRGQGPNGPGPRTGGPGPGGTGGPGPGRGPDPNGPPDEGPHEGGPGPGPGPGGPGGPGGGGGGYRSRPRPNTTPPPRRGGGPPPTRPRVVIRRAGHPDVHMERDEVVLEDVRQAAPPRQPTRTVYRTTGPAPSASPPPRTPPPPSPGPGRGGPSGAGWDRPLGPGRAALPPSSPDTNRRDPGQAPPRK